MTDRLADGSGVGEAAGSVALAVVAGVPGGLRDATGQGGAQARGLNPSVLSSDGDYAEAAAGYQQEALSAATRRAYRSDWADFTAWCLSEGCIALPADAESVARYVAYLGPRRKASTITRRLAAISQAHRVAGFPSPTQEAAVRLTAKGVRRHHGTARVRKAPTLTPDLRSIVATLDLSTPIGLRDRALLLLGFAGALRRSELVALDVADVLETEEGLVVTLRRSKTDQEAQGVALGIPYGSEPTTCPVRSLRAWLRAAGIEAGPLFRPINRHGHIAPMRLSDGAVARIVKRSVARIGKPKAAYAGHSLRAGLATAAALADVPERLIQQQTRHKSLPILRTYIRTGQVFKDNAASRVGL